MSVEALVSQYLTCLRSEGKSPYTVRWHRQSLKQFASWLHAEGYPDDPAQWSTPILRAYITHQKERPKADGRPLSESAVNSLIRSLRAFCSWLHEEEWVDRGLFAKVTVPKALRLVKDTLSTEEVRRLLAVVRQSRRNRWRDEALLLFLLDTGARANEVCSLKLDAVSWDEGIARVMGKGRKERFVPFSAPTAKAMRKYVLRERRGLSDRLFESEEGRPLTPSGLFQVCKRLGHRTGVKAAPHKFRHTFAITYLRNGGSVFALQKTLGHTSLDMTLRYSALLTDDIAREHHEHSPVASLIGGSRRAN